MVTSCPKCGDIQYVEDEKEVFVSVTRNDPHETKKTMTYPEIYAMTNKGRVFVKTFISDQNKWSEWRAMTLPDLSKFPLEQP